MEVVIIQGHPDTNESHLCHALADAYAQGAESAGHKVTLVNVAALNFPILRTQSEFESGVVPEELRAASKALASAGHVALVFPLWLGTMPALLKAFLEQLLRPGVAFEYQAKGLPKKLMSGKSARVIVTMGMPSLVFRIFYRAHGLRGLKRSILQFVWFNPVRFSYFGMVASVAPQKRGEWIEQLREAGRQLT